jgi:hypothetical protein
LHTLPEQAPPAVQLMQLPDALHTMLVPQLLPGESMPVELHCMLPVEQL